VLLHDICPRHQDFGVWRLWDEIKAEFSHSFEFHHSWGLGVVRKPGGADMSQLGRLLFDSSPATREDVRRHYAVYASHLERTLGQMPFIPAPRLEVPSEIRVEVFPAINGRHLQEVCQVRKMPSGKWNTLVFDLRDPSMTGPWRIDPGWEPSFVEVGDVLIHSAESGELIWSSLVSAKDRGLQPGGTAVPHPEERSFLINVGDDPNFLLHSPPDVRGPLTLTVNLKVTPVNAAAMEIVRTYLQTPFLRLTEKLTALEQECLARAAERTALEAERVALVAELSETKSHLQQKSLAESQISEAKRALETELANARQVLVDVENSASWRLTSPLRSVMAALRKRG